MEEPVYYWDPVIAPSGLAFYTGNLFPQWKNSVFVGGLRGMMLDRLTLANDKVVAEEPLLTDLRARIRDVRVGPDGAVYVLTDSGTAHGEPEHTADQQAVEAHAEITASASSRRARILGAAFGTACRRHSAFPSVHLGFRRRIRGGASRGSSETTPPLPATPIAARSTCSAASTNSIVERPRTATRILCRMLPAPSPVALTSPEAGSASAPPQWRLSRRSSVWCGLRRSSR